MSPSLRELAVRPSWFRLLAKHHCGPSTPDRHDAGHVFLHLQKMLRLFLEMQAGVEPANGGFANRSVRPLRHCIISYFIKVFLFYHILIEDSRNY